MRTTVSALAVTGTAVLVVAGCGSGSSSGAATGTARPASASSGPASQTTTASAAASRTGSRLKLSADPHGALRFTRAKLSARAGKVTITMTNPSSAGIPHAIAIEGHGVDRDGATAGPGGRSTVSVKLKPGTYTFYCPVDGHRQAGMAGTLVVH